MTGLRAQTKNNNVFSDDLLRLWFQSVQHVLQHDFAWVTDEAYCSVVLALLQTAFLGEYTSHVFCVFQNEEQSTPTTVLGLLSVRITFDCLFRQ